MAWGIEEGATTTLKTWWSRIDYVTVLDGVADRQERDTFFLILIEVFILFLAGKGSDENGMGVVDFLDV